MNKENDDILYENLYNWPKRTIFVAEIQIDNKSFAYRNIVTSTKSKINNGQTE